MKLLDGLVIRLILQLFVRFCSDVLSWNVCKLSEMNYLRLGVFWFVLRLL